MMNKTIAALSLASALLLPVVAQSQSAKKISIGVSGGGSLPIGELGDGTDPGFAVAGHLFFRPASLKKAQLRADVSYDSWKLSALTGSNLDVTRTSLGVMGNVLLSLGGNGAGTGLYVLGGGGMVRSALSRAVGLGAASLTSTDPGVQGGAGLQFALSGFSTFAEVKVVNVFGEDGSARYIPITFGVRF
jgi:hypothetical protein